MLRLTAIALLLAGCAASRDGTPTLSMHSAKSPADVTECIQAQWMEHGPGLPAIRYPYGEGFTVRMGSAYGNSLLLADAVPEGDGSSVSVSHAFPWHEDLVQRVRGCV